MSAGDFNGDGKDEPVAMYDYGNNNMGLFVFTSSGSTFTAERWLQTGPNNWGTAYTKFMTAGDFNGDGKDEPAAMYDYGNNNMGMFVFTSSGSTFTAERWLQTGPNNWGTAYTKFMTAGDFNGDGKDEPAAMYDYGNNNMGLFVFTASGSTFTADRWLLTGPNNWGTAYTKFMSAGDYDGDHVDEISAMYDYGNNNMGLFVFK
jgi:hypothetical protein